MDFNLHTIEPVYDRFGPEKVDHKLHRKSRKWFDIIDNFIKVVFFRNLKTFAFGRIDRF